MLLGLGFSKLPTPQILPASLILPPRHLIEVLDGCEHPILRKLRCFVGEDLFSLAGKHKPPLNLLTHEVSWFNDKLLVMPLKSESS